MPICIHEQCSSGSESGGLNVHSLPATRNKKGKKSCTYLPSGSAPDRRSVTPDVQVRGALVPLSVTHKTLQEGILAKEQTSDVLLLARTGSGGRLEDRRKIASEG